MSGRKVAVVTGSNQGIGFAIVRCLCKQWDGDVFLTARNVERGQKAVAELEGEGLHPKFHQLDILDRGSIEKLRDFLNENYGGLDLLVNNAAIAFIGSTAPIAEQAEKTMQTNFWATLDVCQILFPLLQPHARVVNVSGLLAKIAIAKMSDAKRQKAMAYKTLEDVQAFMNEFVKDVKAGNHTEKGWPSMPLGMSKVGVNIMSTIQQSQFDDSGKDIVVNSCCPGYTSTNLSRYKGHLTVDEGAETPLYCALLPPDIKEPRGKFLQEKKVVPWHMHSHTDIDPTLPVT